MHFPAKPQTSLLQRLGKIVLARCQRLYYRLAESAGSHKRDFLVSQVEEARNSLKETKDQFQNTLDKFAALVRFDGGNLAAFYRELKHEFDRCEQKALRVRAHISNIEALAQALFDEWEWELEQYKNRTLRSKSRQKLRVTQHHYRQLIGAMRKAESKIDPVLDTFRDQVLFLKHNLNAQAIAALQHELIVVRADIAAMIAVMEHSIRQADQFMQTLAPSALPSPRSGE
jgi:chromosome segregation ATPase